MTANKEKEKKILRVKKIVDFLEINIHRNKYS